MTEKKTDSLFFEILLLDTETIVSSAGTNIIDRSYDSYGRPAGFDLGSDYQVSYGFDSLGRFSSVSFTNLSYSSSASYSYLNNSDLLSGYTVGGIGDPALSVTRTYEQNRNLLTQVKNAVDSTTISQYDYANDGGGRRTSVKNSGTAFDVGNSFNLYGYNSRSEVTGGNRYWGANLNDTSDPVAGQSFGYAYDNIGNRTASSRDNEEVSYTANSLNAYSLRTVSDLIDILGSASTNSMVKVNNLATSRHGKYWHKGLTVTNSASAAYSSVEVIGIDTNSTTNTLYSIETGHVFVAKTPETFVYDDDGNLLSDGRFNYTWDSENRLIVAETLSNLPASVPRVKLEFAYDYMSRRISKQVSNIVSGQWTVVSSHSFIYDSWNLISEICNQQSQVITNTYTWGLDLSGTLQGAGGIGGLVAAKLGTNSVVYSYDANGNVSELTDASSGNLKAHYEYSPFGETIVATGPMAEENEIQFSTKPFECRIRKVLYEHRIYDSENGRFLARDPNGERGGIDLYCFVHNSPCYLIDYLGRYAKPPPLPLPPPDPSPNPPEPQLTCNKSTSEFKKAMQDLANQLERDFPGYKCGSPTISGLWPISVGSFRSCIGWGSIKCTKLCEEDLTADMTGEGPTDQDL